MGSASAAPAAVRCDAGGQVDVTKLRVLYLIDTLGVGGAERSLLTLLPALKEVEPLLCYLNPPATLHPEFTLQNIPVICLNVGSKYGFGHAIRQVMRLVKQYRPDVIHSTLFRADIVGRIAGRMSGLPVVSSIVSDSYGDARMSRLPRTVRWKYRVTRGLDRATARWVTRFVANSQAVRHAKSVSLGVDPDRVTVIYRGRSPQTYVSMDRSQRALARRSWPEGEAAHYALNVGRLIPEKGQETLLDTLALLRHSGRRSAAQMNSHLLIAGEGREEASLRAKADKLGVSPWVHLLGLRHDVPSLLQAADIFLFPSRSEGFPGALVEAMLAGLPIVASGIPVHREIIEAGRTGILVPVDDAAAWAEAWQKLQADPAIAARLGSAAQEDALARFSIDAVATQYELLYQSLAKT